MMDYYTISLWEATAWSDEMQAIAKDKFVPMILASGASSVNMIRTSELSFAVVTQYPDEATGMAAQQRIAEIRSQAAEELPMTLQSAVAGTVFVNG
ncbi:MAG: hypothetical protein QGG88_09080 [Gammaproteobacteria bacterium]|nr:hypothetical protein [Gammaproteobacteria bacterium]